MDEKMKDYKRRYYEKNKVRILQLQRAKKHKPVEPENTFRIEKRAIVLEW